MKLILASASPRRSQLLKEAGFVFDIKPAKVKEKIDKTLSTCDIAMSLAKQKAENVFNDKTGDCAVIGADTIVCFKGIIFTKPKNKTQAKQMLKSLSGNTHAVITGICVMYRDKQLIDFEETLVTFNKLSNKTIDNYVKTGACYDKAGSYGIQDSANLVRTILGDYKNVMGLSIDKVKQLLQQIKEK